MLLNSLQRYNIFFTLPNIWRLFGDLFPINDNCKTIFNNCIIVNSSNNQQISENLILSSVTRLQSVRPVHPALKKPNNQLKRLLGFFFWRFCPFFVPQLSLYDKSTSKIRDAFGVLKTIPFGIIIPQRYDFFLT
jgi:hypothetical protein